MVPPLFEVKVCPCLPQQEAIFANREMFDEIVDSINNTPFARDNLFVMYL